MALTKVSKSVISDNAIDADKLAVTGNGNSGELLASSGDGTFQWTSGIATELYTDNAIAALVDSAPGALDTLNELAAALGDDANFSTTVTNALATKIDGTGTTNYVMKWLDNNTATNSSIFDNGTNVGIGTSSPDSKLDVTGGNITINTIGTTFALFNYGAVGSETSRGSITTDGINLKLNATAQLLLLPTGNVGIGTSSPAAKTHILGLGEILQLETTAARGGGSNTINFNDPTGLKGYLGYGSTGSDVFLLWQRMNEPVLFGTNNAERMRIQGNGNVGIGTSSPNAKLKVTNATASVTPFIAEGVAGYIAVDNVGSGQNYYSANSFHAFQTSGGIERMRIDSSGNVGIGTSSPATTLDVLGSAIINGGVGVGSSGTFQVRQKGDGSSDGIALTSSNNISHRIWKNSSGSLNIGPTSIPSAFVQTLDGNVGIGTTNPKSNLHVAKPGNRNGGSLLIGEGGSGTGKWSFLAGAHYNQDTGSGNGTGSAGIAIAGSYSFSDQNRVIIGGGPYEINAATEISFYTHTSTLSTLGGTERMRITSTGNVGIGTATPSTKLQVVGTVTATALTETSALRFKENIQEDIDASIIDKLRPVSYDWKEDKKKDYGFIAEEVNELDSTLTTQDEEGEMIGIKYTKLIPFLVKKIQEQEERIKQLENGKS